MVKGSYAVWSFKRPVGVMFFQGIVVPLSHRDMNIFFQNNISRAKIDAKLIELSLTEPKTILQ